MLFRLALTDCVVRVLFALRTHAGMEAALLIGYVSCL